MNRTIQNWFTDPQFKESFQDRPYSEKKRIMETYFKEKLAAGNEEFEALPDTEKQRALYNFVYLNMAPHVPKPESRGWLADIGSAAASGLVGAAETGLRVARTVGDTIVGEEAPEEEWTSQALEKLEDFRRASPYLQPSKEATEGLRRWVYEGVQAVVQSVASQGPATALGAVVGGPAGAVGMYALSGGSLYGISAYDEFMETADQRGIDRSVSQPAALKHGIAEGGFEFVTDIVEGITAGIARPLTRPGKQALKNGIKSLLETRAKEVATRVASVTAIETGAEMATAGVQAEIAHNVDMGDERFWSAAQRAFGPSMVAGLIFGGMGAGITALQRREIAARLTDPKADKKKRLEAVAEVGNELRRYSPEMAKAWMINAAICVSKSQAISLDEDLTPPDAGKEPADAPLAATGQSVTDIGKAPGTVKQAGEKAREAEKQAEETQEAVEQTIKAAIDEKHAPEDALTLLARIEESEKALSPGQVEFIRDRVEKLGSVEAVTQAYPEESAVDAYARSLAEQRWGAVKTGETPVPSPDIASDITTDEATKGVEAEPSPPPKPPGPGPEITPQTLVEKVYKARPEIELVYNGMQEGAGNAPGVHLFTFKDPETGNHPSIGVPGELSEEKLAAAIDRKIAEFRGAKIGESSGETSKYAGEVFKHFTTKEAKAALESGQGFDFDKEPIHGTGSLDDGPKTGRFAGKNRIYLSLEDDLWSKSTRREGQDEIVDVTIANSEELKAKGADFFYNYEDQKWQAKVGAVPVTDNLSSVDFRLAEDARVKIIDSEDALRQTADEVSELPRDNPVFWDKLAKHYDAVALINVSKILEETDSKFFRQALGDQIIVLNPGKASIEDLAPKKKTDAVKTLTGKRKKSGFVHDHSSTQINLPKKEADEIRSFANKIPDSEIYEDPNDDSYGREKEPHVTVRYGMDTLDPKEIAPAFEGLGPIRVKMGKVSIFETDEYDVVKVDIESEDLKTANKRVGETVELPGETFKDYKPHATIAYVKKGEGKKYVGDTAFEGKEITVDRVVLVAKDGKMHEFKLKEQGKKEPWEMTRAEYVKSLGLNTKIYPPQKKRLGARLVKLKGDSVWQTDEHGQAVYNAFIEGEPVPPEVLEEYKNESWAKSSDRGEEAQEEEAETETVKQQLSDLYDYALSDKSNKIREVAYHKVAPEEAGQIKEQTGIDVSGYTHVIDNYAIKHSFKEHGDKSREEKRGQEAITKGDVLRLPEVITNYDDIEYADKTGTGRDAIKYRKRFNGEIIVVEEVRTKKKRLMPATIYKLKATTPDASSLGMPPALTSETFRGPFNKKISPEGENVKEEAPVSERPSPSIDVEKPEKPGIEKPEAPIVRGSSSSAYTHRNNKIDFEYAVIEIGDLVKSHDTALHENPSFPKEYQPRKRDRKSMVAQITAMANQIIPEKLGKSSSVSSGAPVVGDDMIVESGNGRTIALQIAYDSGKANQYKQWLNDNAHEFGINPEDLAGIESPVLVRIRKTEVDRAEFAKEANVDEIARMSPYEQARADAERLTEEDLELFRPSEDGSIVSAANQPFISRFISGLGTNEAAGLLTEGGNLTRQGADRIQAAIFAKAYGDERLVTMQSEEVSPDTKNIINALVAASGEFAKARGLEGYRDFDIIPDIIEAAKKVREARKSGVSIKQILDQQDLFDIASEEAGDIAVFMDANIRSARRMGLAFKRMASIIRNGLLDRRQIKMFAAEPVTKKEAIKRGIEYAEQGGETGKQTGLFEAPAERGDEGGEQAGDRRTPAGVAEGVGREEEVKEKPASEMTADELLAEWDRQAEAQEKPPEMKYSIASVRPWPEDFPKAIPHTNQSKLVNHPDHKKAKAGDSEAASRLVEDLINPARARELAEKYPDALLAPVHAVEASGRNKIPHAFAQAISDITGLKIAEDIVQANLTAHTLKNRLQRLLTRANFEGTVIPGQTYVLVDDTAAQGGTLHELRHYIENNGGNVVAVTILGFGRGATVIAVKPGTIQSIERKHGREETERFLREYNISGNIEALTEGEARYILSFSSIDALRARCLEEGYSGVLPKTQGPFQTLGVEDSLSFPKPLPAITRENLEAAFPGAYVAPQAADGNFNVRLSNGAEILVEKTGKITVSKEWINKFRPDLAGKGEQTARGAYSPKRRTIYLTTLAGQDTVDEETFHAAVDIALTDQEKAILERDYGDEEKQASEYVAWVADSRRKPNTIFQKILDFFRRIKEIFFPTGKGTFAKVASGEVWKRPARPAQGQELSQAARRLINTPEFKKWFKGSMVVDENGEPLVVYHGTSAPTDFDSFAPDISDLGSHFTVEPAVASYVTGKTGRRRVFPVYLSIKNPLRLTDMGQWDSSFVLPRLKELGIASAKEIEEIETRIFESLDTVQAAGDRFIRLFLRKKGYDGIVYLNRRELLARGETTLPARRWAESLESNELSDEEFRAKFPMARDSYIAFEPTQIKSIFNRGTYSETDTSILHQAQEPKSGAEFVKAPDGSIDFGRIDEKIGKAIKRQAGPIRLQAGEESNAAKYGLVHISARHGKKILKSGFTDIKEFVYGITSNWTEIRKGSAGSLFLAKRNGENDIAVVKLRPGDGEDFYSVVSAWRARRGWIDKKKLLWERREPARSTSGVDPRLQPSSQTRPEGEPPNASSQSLTDKIVTASEDEVKPKDDLLYQLQPPGPQVTRDLEEDRSFANRIFEQRDLGVHRAQLETQELQKQVQALTGKASRRRHVLGFAYDSKLKRSMESDRLDMAMMVHRDLQINPEKAEEFKAWANKALADPQTPGRDKIRIREQLDTLERALALTDDQKALVDEIGSRFDRAFQVARANNIVNTFTDHYVRRIWNLPAGKEEDLRSSGSAYGFKTYTTAKQQRKFVTMIDGWMGGYDLKVKGLTNSYGAYITDLETILANKDFIRQGYSTRDTSGNRLFSTSKKSGYEKLEVSGFKVWEWAGKAEAETPPDGSQALLMDDHGRKFFYGQVERIPESWAVFKDDETKHPSKVFYDPEEAKDWADEKGYERIEHRPEKDVANAWEERPLYAPKQLAGIINRMTRSDRLFSGTPGADALLRFNAGMKSWILLSSFFHHLAGARSWAFAVHHGWKGGRKLTDPLTGAEYRTAGVNPVKAYKAGLKRVEDRHPLITLGIKNGLTLGDIQDWSETMLRDRKGFSERLANYLGLETAAKTMEAGRFFREQFTDSLFKKYFAGLKAEAFVMEYIHDLQRAHDAHVKGGPAPDPDAIAERVARLINEDFGGLHLQRMGRNPTLQKISRLLLLAPDWCVVGDTRAMTKNGWKRFDQLKIGDEIMAFDPQTHTLKWSRMKDKYVNLHYRGQMVQVSNFNRSILMTPEHTCFVRNFTTKRYEVVKAKDLQTNHLIPRRAPFPAPEEPVLSDELVRLAGWLVTDGNLCNIRWTRKDGTEGRSQCGKITQSKPKNVEILKETGLAYYIDKHNSDHGKYKARYPKYVFNIPATKLRELHAAGIEGKSLSWEFLSKLTEKQRQILYDTMFLGDGTGQKRFCGKEKAVFWMTMLQTLMGLPTTFYQQEENCWRTRWITRGKDISVWGHHSNLRTVAHEGVIWCPSVDTGFWLAERNGLMFITGNTESNFRTVTGLIPGLNNWIDRMTGGLPAPKGMNEIYRKFWGRVALRIAASTILAQLLLNGKDDTDDFWKEQALSNRFHKFRWTQVDITKFYEALGIDPDARMTFSIGGHFLQPLNLFDPLRLIKAKSSPLARIVEAGFSGTDWAQRPFTAMKTLFGKGRTVKGSPYEETEGFFNRLPSTVANQVTGMQPIQVGYLIRYLQGEADGLSSIMGSMGIATHKAWPPRKTEPIARAEENDPAYDLVSDLADEELLRLGPPSARITVNGIPRKLTREQYEEYFEKSSEIARRKLKMVMKSAAFSKLPKEKQAQIVGNIIQSARKKARALIKQRIIRSKTSAKPGVDRKAAA